MGLFQFYLETFCPIKSIVMIGRDPPYMMLQKKLLVVKKSKLLKHGRTQEAKKSQSTIKNLIAKSAISKKKKKGSKRWNQNKLCIKDDSYPDTLFSSIELNKNFVKSVQLNDIIY